MNHQPFRFTIYAKLPQRKESPAEIGAKFLNAVDALTRIDHLFAHWEVLDLPAMQSLPLSDARPRIAEIVENNVVRDRHGVPQPESGYHGIGVTQNVALSRVVTLRAEAGALFGRGIRLEFGDILNPTDPAILDYLLFKQALLVVVATWQPIWAYAYAFRMDYWKAPLVPGMPRFRYSHFHIPWIAYLSPALSTGFVVLQADMRVQHAPGGGLLLSATEERFDPANPEHLRRAQILAKAMIDRTGDKVADDNPP
jgi:hypothetical protein